MANNKPKFSAGIVTTVITVFFLAIFGFAIMHGFDGLNQHQVVSQASK